MTALTYCEECGGSGRHSRACVVRGRGEAPCVECGRAPLDTPPYCFDCAEELAYLIADERAGR